MLINSSMKRKCTQRPLRDTPQPVPRKRDREKTNGILRTNLKWVIVSCGSSNCAYVYSMISINMRTWLTDIVDASHSNVLARVTNIRPKIGRIFCFIISTSKITSFCRRNINEPPNIFELKKINQAGTQIVLNSSFFFPKLVFLKAKKASNSELLCFHEYFHGR